MDEVIMSEAPIEAAEVATETKESTGDDLWTNFESVGVNLNDVVEAKEDNESEAKPVEAEAKEEEIDPEETPDFLDVKFNHEDKKLSKKEARSYAQKGMNYDKVKNDLEEANAENSKLKVYEDFLNELKGDFGSIDELMVDTKARMRVKAEADKGNTITLENAKDDVRKTLPKAPDPKKLQADKAVKAFTNIYGQMKPDAIPKEVWDVVKVTGDLTKAYHDYEKRTYESKISELEKELKALKTNEKNSAISSGSSKSSGKSTNAKSYLDSIWDKI